MFARAAAWIAASILFTAAAFAAGQRDAADLPEGDGKKILESACTSCHDLGEVKKFKGYYTKENWQDIVTTMVKYGAPVKDDQIPVLVEYLTKNFGKN